MQILVDPLKLLGIPELDSEEKPIEKIFASGFTQEEIFSGGRNGNDFTIKFSQGTEVLGSIINRPENIFLKDEFPTFSFSHTSGRYFIFLRFDGINKTHGSFEIQKKE